MRTIAVVFAFQLLVGISVAQQPRAEIFCKTDNLRVELPPAAPVKVNDLRLVSEEQGSSAALYIQNSSKEPIRRVVLVLEFLSGHKDHLFTEVFSAAPRGSKVPPLFGFEIRQNDDIHELLLPNEYTVLHAASTIVATRCPVETRLGYLYAETVDSPPYLYSSKVVRTDQTLIRVPMTAVDRRPLEGDVSITIVVDNLGKATLESASTPSLPLFESLRKWVEGLEFAPATFAEHPITSNMQLLLRFRQTPQARSGGWPSECYETLCRFVIMDVIHGKDLKRRPEFWLGGLPIQPK
jgi:hypothetical protein